MNDDDAAELIAARNQIREHYAVTRSAGKDPLNGVMWGPRVERFDRLLHALAHASSVAVTDLPWTNVERVDADDSCRVAGLLDGPPLLAG